MTDSTERRRQLGRERQARFRKAHRGQLISIQVPSQLHASLKRRAGAAGLPIHRYIALKAGA